ncbi:MAG: HAD hydrolase-like protein [Verrucomicrobiota bacterium]
MKPKFLILDKDGTFIQPKSGSQFVQNPKDQELIPGALEAVQYYVNNEGYKVAIATNQGGCDTYTVKASQVKVGNILVSHSFNAPDLRVMDVRPSNYLVEFLLSNLMIAGYHEDDNVVIRYKSQAAASDELAYAINLLKMNLIGYLCPDISGHGCIQVQRIDSEIYTFNDLGYTDISKHPNCYGQFRKPGPGMINAARMQLANVEDWQSIECLYVGDRTEDEEAAEAAGVAFMWAEDWLLPFLE